MENPTLDETYELIMWAHAGQKYGDQPYVVHPLAVSRLVREHGEEAQHAAMLHDVVEDTNITLDDLKHMGYSDNIIDAVDAVTRRKGEVYLDFVHRAAEHPLGRIIKLADNTHNMSTLPKGDGRLKRYEKARKILLAAQE